MSKAIKSSPSSLRIIGGSWRGRKLSFPALDGLRPTGDRIRETLFNWLQGELPGAVCLDLFAGSGALGFEAVSRGAAFALLVERDASAVRQLQLNCEILQTRTVEVKQGDALGFLAGSSNRQFNVVFIDPPFASDLWAKACDALMQGQWLAPGAWMYVETPPETTWIAPTTWRLHRQKQAGQVIYRLYQLSAEALVAAEPRQE